MRVYTYVYAVLKALFLLLDLGLYKENSHTAYFLQCFVLPFVTTSIKHYILRIAYN